MSCSRGARGGWGHDGGEVTKGVPPVVTVKAPLPSQRYSAMMLNGTARGGRVASIYICDVFATSLCDNGLRLGRSVLSCSPDERERGRANLWKLEEGVRHDLEAGGLAARELTTTLGIDRSPSVDTLRDARRAG